MKAVLDIMVSWSYKVFRSHGKVDKGVRGHELVAVEYGPDIHAVTDKLIRTVNDDATGLPQFEKGYTACSMPRRSAHPTGGSNGTSIPYWTFWSRILGTATTCWSTGSWWKK